MGRLKNALLNHICIGSDRYRHQAAGLTLCSVSFRLRGVSIGGHSSSRSRDCECFLANSHVCLHCTVSTGVKGRCLRQGSNLILTHSLDASRNICEQRLVPREQLFFTCMTKLIMLCHQFFHRSDLYIKVTNSLT